MTDRYNALIVVLDKDIRDDDAEQIINAIQQIKHVTSVKGNITTTESYIAETRAKREIWDKIFDVFQEKTV